MKISGEHIHRFCLKADHVKDKNNVSEMASSKTQTAIAQQVPGYTPLPQLESPVHVLGDKHDIRIIGSWQVPAH